MKALFQDLPDEDQKRILMVYNFYTSENELSYLQYTSACALFFYLTQKGFFNYNLDETLVYDYLQRRRYIWESKKFMKDINELRNLNFLIRARCKSLDTRDVNAHQCSDLGKKYIEDLIQREPNSKQTFCDLKNQLGCDNVKFKSIVLGNSEPYLECNGKIEPIKNFIKAFNDDVEKKFVNIKCTPFFL